MGREIYLPSGAVENVAARQPNIEAAIRRSRGARAKRQSRRRRSLAIAAAFSAALGGAGILSLDAMTGNDVLEAAVAKAQSLSELFNERSPGERTSAQLTKTTHARALAKTRPHVAVPAQQHELARILMPPPANVRLELAPPVPMASLIPPSPVSGFMAPGPGGGGAIVSPPSSDAMVAPPGGGGGINPPAGGTEVIPNEPREPVPSAVPEPSTWALMLLGFGLVGWRSRRTRSALSLA